MKRIYNSHNLEEDERFTVRVPNATFSKDLDRERDKEVDDAIKRLKFERFYADNKKIIGHVLDFIRNNPSAHKLLLMPHNAKMAEPIARWIFDNYECNNQKQ